MPSYNYRCKTCGATFSVIHSIKDTWDKCSNCPSTEIQRTVAPFLANTETSFEAKQRHHEDQTRRDIDRFHKDDKFAANLTGQEDANSAKRRQQVIDKENKKQEAARQKIKRLDP